MISFILSFFKRKSSNSTTAKRQKAPMKKEEGPLDYPECHYEYGFRPFWV